MERLSQIAHQTKASAGPPAHPGHPLDPLTVDEIRATSEIVKKKFDGHVISFNTITLKEPTKKDFLAWRDANGPMPARVSYFVLIESGCPGVKEGLVSIDKLSLISSRELKTVQPILTVEDLINTQDVIRNDPNVIEQCVISGVPRDQMDHIYCEPWTVGYDERWGASRRLQQALMYYRHNEDDSHFSHPLDFCPIVDMNLKKVIYIDIPNRRRKIDITIPNSNYMPKDIIKKYGKMRDEKPIDITQPEGVSFEMNGNCISWNNFTMHVGFNYREGIVLSDIRYNDHGNVRPLFHRISLSEMIVPYGNPDHPHQRKHALDIGEYGAGYMTNPLTLGCDCKGVIHYLDAHFVDSHGDPITIKHAVCIHEEDDGLLCKHSDFRDSFATTIVTRSTKLVVSQIFTAGNYEYCIYWSFMMDGTIKLDLKLTGCLNTYVMDEKYEKAAPWGCRVYPHVNAHNHQHLFALRIHPRIDGDGNSTGMAEPRSSPYPTGSPENMYGNAWYSHSTKFIKSKDSVTDYVNGRTWDFFNPNKVNKYSRLHPCYKLVSFQCPPMLAQPGSLPYKRAPWAHHTFQVIPYKEDRLYPSGDFVPQWSGDGMVGFRKWYGNGEDNIDNTDILCFHVFGISHVPAPEDFPMMPSEPIALLLRPRNFFTENPSMDVPPSYSMTTTEARTAKNHQVHSANDTTSRYAFSSDNDIGCCTRFSKEK